MEFIPVVTRIMDFILVFARIMEYIPFGLWEMEGGGDRREYTSSPHILRPCLQRIIPCIVSHTPIGSGSPCSPGCEYGGLCKDGRCICQDKCTSKAQPICAKDEKTVRKCFILVYQLAGSKQFHSTSLTTLIRVNKCIKDMS